MTPDERTEVLQIILENPLGSGHIACPTSWLTHRLNLGASDGSVETNWQRLTVEQRLIVWLEAPDSDYVFSASLSKFREPLKARRELAARQLADATYWKDHTS